MTYPRIPFLVATLVTSACLSAFGQDPSFEFPPTLSAAEILKPEFIEGPNFKVRDAVPTFGGRNDYMIDSEFGTFEANGNAMLIVRLREIGAIAKLRDVSRTDEYTQALGNAAESPLLLAKSLITNPVSTVSGVPGGLWKMMNRAGESIKDAAQGQRSGQDAASSAKQLIGFDKAKRAVALELGVDPYSSNEVLQRELNGVAWAAFAGKMTFTLATMPIGGGAGIALTAANVTDQLNAAIRDQSPTDLRLSNLKSLLAMDVSRAQADAFLNNSAFSPTLQTALVMHLATLADTANRASFVQLATEQSTNESDALFFLTTARVLAELQTRGRSIAQLQTLDYLPIAIGTDGEVIAALEWDYLAWTEGAAEFAAQLKAVKVGDKEPTGFLVAITGDASPIAQSSAQAAGVQMVMRLAPGPLK